MGSIPVKDAMKVNDCVKHKTFGWIGVILKVEANNIVVQWDDWEHNSNLFPHQVEVISCLQN